MKKIPFYISFFIACIAMSFFSCKNKNASTRTNAINRYSLSTGEGVVVNADGAMVLSLHMPDTTINYDIVTKSNNEEEINGEKRTSESKITMRMRYDIKRDTSAKYNLRIHYTKFIADLKSNDDEKEIDASTAVNSPDLSIKLFSVFNNAAVNAIVTQKGDVIAISGVEELDNKLYSIAGVSTTAFNNVSVPAKQFLKAEFFKKNIEQVFRIFPSKPVKEGDTWELTDTLESDMKLPIKTIYKLESIDDDGIATISQSSDIAINQPIPVQGYTVSAQLQGSEEGEIKLDIATGLIQKGQTTLKLKGTVGVLNKEVPLELKLTSEITGK